MSQILIIICNYESTSGFHLRHKFAPTGHDLAKEFYRTNAHLTTISGCSYRQSDTLYFYLLAQYIIMWHVFGKCKCLRNVLTAHIRVVLLRQFLKQYCNQFLKQFTEQVSSHLTNKSAFIWAVSSRPISWPHLHRHALLNIAHNGWLLSVGCVPWQWGDAFIRKCVNSDCAIICPPPTRLKLVIAATQPQLPPFLLMQDNISQFVVQICTSATYSFDTISKSILPCQSFIS